MTDDGGPNDFPRDERPPEGFGDRGSDRDDFTESEFADDDGSDVDDVDDGFAPGVVRDTVHTVCHLCGGLGEIADPVLALRGGAPFTINPGRPCPCCAGDGHLPGIRPPV